MVLIPLLGATLSASSLGQTLATSASPTNKVVQLVLPHSAPLAFVGGSGAAGTNAAVVLAEFVEAGFTHSWAAFTGLPDDQVMLDAASAAGVKIIVKQQAKPVSAVDVARRFKNHPALAGYMLMDEPSTADFPALAKMAREVLALDAEKLVLVNLYPTYATKEQLGIKPFAEYTDYVYKFLSEVPVNLLSYDFYPIMRLELLPDWHQNLNVGYEAARKCKIPLWVWIASAGMELTPDPTIGSLRLQAYNNLAYGATGIEHFTYHNHSWMRAACIERDSSRSPTFDLVKQLHRELQAQAGVFVGSIIQRIGFAGAKPPKGTTPWKPYGGITSVEAGNKGAVVSSLKKANHRFLVVVNQDYLDPVPLSLRWKSGMAVGSAQKDGTVQMLEGSSLQTQVGPGDALILMWEVPK
jgi:hypothetical protein